MFKEYNLVKDSAGKIYDLAKSTGVELKLKPGINLAYNMQGCVFGQNNNSKQNFFSEVIQGW